MSVCLSESSTGITCEFNQYYQLSLTNTVKIKQCSVHIFALVSKLAIKLVFQSDELTCKDVCSTLHSINSVEGIPFFVKFVKL